MINKKMKNEKIMNEKMKLVFATNNAHKLRELREILGEGYKLLSLADIGCHEDIPEDGATLEENSLAKAKYVFDHYGYDCFADDTGLEVDALGGEPGVHSARYAEGTDHDSEANMRKLLAKLGNNNNRKARFRTIITLIRRQDAPSASPRTASAARWREKSPWRSMARRASATTPSLSPKATTSRLPNWARPSKTKFPTEEEPSENWWRFSTERRRKHKAERISLPVKACPSPFIPIYIS